MALSIPLMTWQFESDVKLLPGNDRVQLLEDLYTQITYSIKEWRVIDHNLGSGDTYLWVAPPATAFNAADRIFIFCSGSAIDAANLADLSRNSGYVFIAYCPGHGGATPDNTNPGTSTPVSSSRWTKCFGVVDPAALNYMYLILSEEVFALALGATTATMGLTIAGPFVSAEDDAAGESGAKGRLYAFAATGDIGTTNGQIGDVWTAASSSSFFDCATLSGYTTFVLFDPVTPANLIRVKKLPQYDTQTPQYPWQELYRTDGSVHILRPEIPVVGNGAGTNPTTRFFGHLRQIRPGRNRANYIIYADPQVGTVQSVVFALSTTDQTIAFDNN